ncbi:MAG: hypothetical protein R3E39_04455 [Anaerolineae bacterium]
MVDAIDLKDYVAGGYFIAKYATEGFQPSALLPERVISLSSCIGKPMDVVWGWDIALYQKEIADFGFRADRLVNFQAWCAERVPGGISELEGARFAAKEFVSADTKVVLLGAGLHCELVAELVKQVPTFAMNDKKSLADGATSLGFEVLSHFSHQFSCSWLCSGLEKYMSDVFGIRPNRYGLIDSYAEAKQVYEWIAEDNMQGIRAEPLPYFPWLIVQYDVK